MPTSRFAFSDVLAKYEKELKEQIRQGRIFKYDVHKFPDEHGRRSFRLCVRKERHYELFSQPGKSEFPLPKNFTPCDGSCEGFVGEQVEIKDPKMLFGLGFYVQLAADKVLLVDTTSKGKPSYNVSDGGSYVSPQDIKRGHLLKNGESIQMERSVDEPIDITPFEDRAIFARYNRNQRVVTVVTDTITNKDGKSAVTSTEHELRKQQEAVDLRVEEARRKSNQARGREAANFLYDLGFNKEQVDYLFKIAGPKWFEDVIEYVRKTVAAKERLVSKVSDGLDWSLGNDYDNISALGSLYDHRPVRRYKDWDRIRAGAGYIISIGGIPVDNKKK